jgi:hypothetical protein
MNIVKTIRISKIENPTLILDIETLLIEGHPPIIDRLIFLKKEKKRIHYSLDKGRRLDALTP